LILQKKLQVIGINFNQAVRPLRSPSNVTGIQRRIPATYKTKPSFSRASKPFSKQ